MTAAAAPEKLASKSAPSYVSKRYFTRSVLGVGGAIVSLIAVLVGAVAAVVSAMLGYGNRATAGIATLAILLTSIIGIGTANYLDTYEFALISAEANNRMGNLMVATIDSGATSTAISSKHLALLKRITEERPNQQIKIARKVPGGPESRRSRARSDGAPVVGGKARAASLAERDSSRPPALQSNASN